MADETPTGPSSRQETASQDLLVLPGPPGPPGQQAHKVMPALPALPAHPEWVEIVVPWGQKAPKVVQGKMDLQAPRGPGEHPVCPVHLVKWARPPPLAQQDLPAPPGPPGPPAPPGPPGQQARKVMPVLPVLPAQQEMPVLPVLPVLPAHPEMSARKMVPQDQLDRLVSLVHRAFPAK